MTVKIPNKMTPLTVALMVFVMERSGFTLHDVRTRTYRQVVVRSKVRKVVYARVRYHTYRVLGIGYYLYFYTSDFFARRTRPSL